MIKNVALVATVVLLCAGAARAAGNQINVLGGFAVPLTRVDFGSVGGSTESIGATGGFVAGQFFHAVHPRISLGGEISFISNGSSDINSLPTTAANSSMDAVSFLALLKGYFNDSKSIRFYGSGGIGLQDSQFHSDVHPRAGFAWADTGTTETRHFNSNSVTSFAFALGFGFEATVTDAFMLGAEARIQDTAAGDYSIANVNVDRLHVGNFILAAKAGLRF